MAISEDGRLRRWFTSTKHFAGAAVALAGPVLAIVGTVSAPVGLALMVPLYAAGALAAPARKPRPDVMLGGVDGDDVLKRLDELQKDVRGRLPQEVIDRVAHITNTIRDTMPRVDELGPGSQQIHTMVQTATDYLPEALATYLRLPSSYANHRVVTNGKTPLQLLCDQLDLLSSKMDEVFQAVCRADADALVAHGQFLADKFAPGSLDLGTGPATPPAL